MESAAKARKTRRSDSAASASRARLLPPRSRTDSHDATTDADEDDDERVLDEESKENEPDDAATGGNHDSHVNLEERPAAGKRKRKRREEEEDDEEEEASIQSEMGVIEEVYCENFMCHRKLRVQLSPHINFITGENGSGKSAIIAAIQICLGVSARNTHRGRSIRDLIRHGHEGNALVRVTLRNDTEDNSDAFRPELFGKRIGVERLIRRDGTTEYRLKNAKGETVTKHKDDLDAMLDHLNIQTENPCVILDQENAKLFLKGDQTDKYKFFLKSTNLYKMRTIFTRIDEAIPIYDGAVRREATKLVSLHAVMDEAAKQWEDAQGIGALETQLAQYKKELAWAFVVEKEVTAAKKADQIQQMDLPKKQEVSKRAAFKGQAMEEKLKQKNDELEAMTARLRDAQRVREAKAKHVNAERLLKCKHEAELKRISQQKNKAKLRIQRLEAKIDEKRRAHEADRQRRSQHNDDLQRQVLRKRDALATMEQDLEAAKQRAQPSREAMDDLDLLEQEHQDCVHQRRETNSEIHRVHDHLSRLRSHKQNRVAVFGSRIPQLQQLIKENIHRFEAPPIGPLGIHVKLPEKFKDFAVAVEVALKGTLQSYLVVSGRDKALLDELRGRARCPPGQASITIAKRTGSRYANLWLPEGDLAAHAICNILEVDNDDVFNALVDICSIENKLVFDKKATAEERVLRGNSGSFRMARNVSEVFMGGGDKFIVRDGNLAYIANKGSSRSSIICQDVEGEMRDLETHLRALNAKLESLQRDEAQLRRQIEDRKEETRRESKRVDCLTREFHQRRVELRNMEEEMAEDGLDGTLDVSVFEAEIDEAKRELDESGKREAELKELLGKGDSILDDSRKELEELKIAEAEVASELAEVKEDVDGLFKQLREMKALAFGAEREAADAKASVTKLEAELQTIRDECDARVEKAKTVCGYPQRVHVSKTTDFYAKKLTDIRLRIEAERARFQGMDIGDLEAEKLEKTNKFEQKKVESETFKANVERLQSMLEVRELNWEGMRKGIATCTSNDFNEYMINNNFAGKLKIDPHNQQLEIVVVHQDPGRTRKSSVTDMKVLSGGERSFAQVALLLGLGKNIECPFRVMDEFDVFMDAMNRDMTIELLVDGAMKEAGKQFIFVTPNDLSVLHKHRGDPRIKIQKMDPPRDRLNAEQHA